MRRILPLLAIIIVFAAAPALAAAHGLTGKGVNTDRLGDALLIFLVLSVALEAALTPLFNWRIYMRHLEGKGAKTVITVILAYLVLYRYDLDVFRDIVVAFGVAEPSEDHSFVGQVLTAFLVAGGSDGILRIYDKLKIRDLKARKEKADKIKADAGTA